MNSNDVEKAIQRDGDLREVRRLKRSLTVVRARIEEAWATLDGVMMETFNDPLYSECIGGVLESLRKDLERLRDLENQIKEDILVLSYDPSVEDSIEDCPLEVNMKRVIYEGL